MFEIWMEWVPRRLRLVRELVAVLLLVMPGLAVAAQAFPGAAVSTTADETSAEPVPVAPPSPNDLRELMRLLSDASVVAWLQEQSMDLAEGDALSMEYLSPQEWLSMRLDGLEERLARRFRAWLQVRRGAADLRRHWMAQMGEGETLRSLIYVLIFLIIGVGLEWLYWRYAASVHRRIETADSHSGGPTWTRTGLRALLSALGIALFAIGTLGAFLTFEWARPVELLVLSLLLAVVTIRIVNTIVVFVLCPRVPSLRPIPVSTAIARRVYRWTMAIVVVACMGGLMAVAIERMELKRDFHLVVSSTTGTIVMVLMIAAIWLSRLRAMPSETASVAASRHTLALRNFAPMLSSLLVLVLWALWVSGAMLAFWTLLVLSLLFLADRGCGAMLSAESQPSDSVEGSGSPADATGRRVIYAPVLERLARFVLIIVSALLLNVIWSLDLGALSSSPTIAGRVFGAAIDVLVAVLVADLIWLWAKTAIDDRLRDYVPPEPGHAPGPEARMVTLLPLLRKILMVTLSVMVVLVALSSLGVNVGPLLAGAGVVGIAVGFGAQTLVRDIVSGIFFLLDDAFRVGEYIEVGDLRGTVEAISIRSLRLRHHRGAVHTVPFGEMKSLTNHSRDWVIMKLELRVPFDTDLKLVKKLVKGIGAELLEDDELGPSVIEPLKSQGVRRMEEFNMVVGVKFMSKPGEQWLLRKEAYQRIRDAFDKNGIVFAQRNVKVEVVGADASSPEVRDAAIGAAQDAIEDQLGPAPGAAAPSKP